MKIKAKKHDLTYQQKALLDILRKNSEDFCCELSYTELAEKMVDKGFVKQNRINIFFTLRSLLGLNKIKNIESYYSKNFNGKKVKIYL
jgi:hypothetical protein